MYSSYYYQPSASELNSAVSGAVAGGFAAAFFAFLSATWLIILVLAVLKFIGAWKMFKKAGIDGWESLITGHNLFVEFQLAGIKTYWFFLLFVPFANIVVMIWKDIELAKAYGKGVGFGLGLFFLNPIFVAILGLGKSQYQGTFKAGKVILPDAEENSKNSEQ